MAETFEVVRLSGLGLDPDADLPLITGHMEVSADRPITPPYHGVFAGLKAQIDVLAEAGFDTVTVTYSNLRVLKEHLDRRKTKQD